MTGAGAEGGAPRRRSPFATISVYAAVALLGTALFIFLHHLGNQIHYRTAAQRFAAELESERPDAGFAAGFNTPFEHCKLSAMVLAGAFRPQETGVNGFRDALLPKVLSPETLDYYNYCDELATAVSGRLLYEHHASPQYWWGSKALYAVMLHTFSVQDIRLLIRYATYAGWVALAAALLLLAPRTLVILAPLILFGSLFSGIRWFSGVPNGTPYAWMVWACVALVVVMRVRPRSGMTPEQRLQLMRLVCFAAGMVSIYLWLGDAITVLPVTLIGMLVYFGYDHRPGPARRARLAGGCIGLWGAGFVAAFVLGQAAKMGLEACLVPDLFAWRTACEGAPDDGWTWWILTSKLRYNLDNTVEASTVGLFSGTAGVSILETYWQVGLGSVPAGRILTWVATISCAAAAGVAALQARRGRPELLRAILWIAALVALTAVQLLVPDDLMHRRGRYLFVPYALGLCCMLAAVMETGVAARAARAWHAAGRALARTGVVRRAARLDGLSMFLVALGGVGALLVLLREAAYGPGLTADSALYVSAARNLLDGNGLVTFLGAPYRAAAPLFPLTLAGAGLFGVDAVTAAGYVNAAAFGLTTYAVAAWVRSRVRSRLLVIWAGCACVLSTSLAEVAAYAWPEIPFILFAVVSLSTLDRFLRTGRRSSLLQAAAAAAAACLTHYAGVTLIGSGALLLLLPRTTVLRSRLAAAAVWSGAAAAPLGAWLARNLFVSGASLGPAGPEGFLLLPSLHTATGEVVRWLIGGTGLGLLDGLAMEIGGFGATDFPHVAVLGLRIAVLLVPVAVGYALVRRHLREHHPVATTSLVFVAAYALYLPIALSAADAELELRHLTPLFPPLLATATVVMDQLFSKVRPARRGPVRRRLAATLLFSLWFVPQAGASAAHVEGWLANGGGYASRRWSESEVIRYLNAAGPEAAIHGSDGAALYLLTPAADSGPYQLPQELARARAQLSARDAAGRKSYVVWFHRGSGRYGYDLEPLIRTPGMEVAAAMEDGVILRSGAAGAPAAPPEAGSIMPFRQDAVIGVQSGFTVYLDATANRLIYLKNGCGAADVEARFFLHVIPINHNDLPAHPWVFHNLDFPFHRHGFRYRGRCVAIRDLPDYPIAHLATGQYTLRDGPLWTVTLAEPAARRDFTVHLRGNTLIYLKEPCAAQDAQAEFFLHLRPAAADLPPYRRADGHGLDSLDFDFREYGVAADGRCRAVVPLPLHEIAGVRTGQYAAAGGELWSAEFTATKQPPAPPELTIAKWFDAHAAAISITYDGMSKGPNRVDELVRDLGLVLDYEMVTQRYVDRVPARVEHDLTELIPDVVPGDLYEPLTDAEIEHGLSLTAHGFGFFGHGHWHVDHDALTYAQAYDSFRLCFEVMESLGLEPVAYAYPRGAGGEAETQQALADAGFLAGRLSFPASQPPYIVPDADTTPENWFYLPGLTMESIDFRQCEWCINDTRELAPILDQALDKTAWIIPVYHNIGSGAGWGFYDWEDFEGDVRAIAARDFWLALMNDVVLYLREREQTEVTMQVIEQDGMTRRIAFVLADGLDDDRFDQPLTVLFTRPADWFGVPLEVTRNGRLVARIPAFTETYAISLPPNEEQYLVQPARGAARARAS